MNELESKMKIEEEKNELRTESGSNIKRIIVLIPMTIPGNGKTFFYKSIKL
jgi:hypothetical protein